MPYDRPFAPPYSVLGYRSLVPLAKFQMTLMPSSRMSSGSKKKEPSTKLEELCSFNKVPDGPYT